MRENKEKSTKEENVLEICKSLQESKILIKFPTATAPSSPNLFQLRYNRTKETLSFKEWHSSFTPTGPNWLPKKITSKGTWRC